jgi:hypothetical protein
VTAGEIAGDRTTGELVKDTREHVEGGEGGRQWPDREALDGPFTSRQLLRLDESLRNADRLTGLVFSVYVGELEEPVRAHAEKLHAQLPDPARGVLLAISPNQRVLEIVTGPIARRRLPDRDCQLEAMGMADMFGKGNLAGGIVAGLTQLTDKAGSA